MSSTPLLKLRMSRGMTQADLAEAVGIDQACVSRYERGLQTPSPENATRIAQFFGDESFTELHLLYPERFQASAAP